MKYTFNPFTGNFDTILSSHSELADLTADDHTQYLLLAGRSTGQRIGTATQTGNSDDIAMSGRLNIGTLAFVANVLLQASANMTNTSGSIAMARVIPIVTASGASLATYMALQTIMTGGNSITSGSPTFYGASYQVQVGGSGFVTGVVVTEVSGMKLLAQATTAGGTVADLAGFNATAQGGSGYIGNLFSITNLSGMISKITVAGHNATNLTGIDIRGESASPSFKHKGVAINGKLINFDNFGTSATFSSSTTNGTVSLGSAIVTSVSGIATVVNGMYVTGTGIPANTYVTGVDIPNSRFTMNNVATGSASTVTLGGAITTLYCFNHQQVFSANIQKAYYFYLLNNLMSVHRGSLTLGATTDPTATLDVQGTANVTSTSTFGGDITVSAINLITDTTTGTKIGTATNQKFGFWNSTPVIQHATTGETSGFTAGTGTAVNDDSTFTGNVGSTAYRISDIVKALKNAGIMAS